MGRSGRWFDNTVNCVFKSKDSGIPLARSLDTTNKSERRSG